MKMKITEISKTDYSVSDDYMNPEFNSEQLKYIQKTDTISVAGRNVSVGKVVSSECFYMEKDGFLIMYVEGDIFADGIQVHSSWRDVNDRFGGSKETEKLIGPLYTELVKKYGTVYSDDLQTDDGQFLWMRLLVQAKNKGYEVGYYFKGEHTNIQNPHNIDFIWENPDYILYISKP